MNRGCIEACNHDVIRYVRFLSPYSIRTRFYSKACKIKCLERCSSIQPPGTLTVYPCQRLHVNFLCLLWEMFSSGVTFPTCAHFEMLTVFLTNLYSQHRPSNRCLEETWFSLRQSRVKNTQYLYRFFSLCYVTRKFLLSFIWNSCKTGRKIHKTTKLKSVPCTCMKIVYSVTPK